MQGLPEESSVLWLYRVQAFSLGFKHIPQGYNGVKSPGSSVPSVQYKSQSLNTYFAVTAGAATYSPSYCIHILHELYFSHKFLYRAELLI